MEHLDGITYSRNASWSRRALAVVFFVNGVVLANWYPRIPTVKRSLDMTESQLGLALLGVAVGSLIAMPLTGLAAHRFGHRSVIQFVIGCYGGAFSFVPFAATWWSLGLALLLLGAAVGALDVAMNAAGTALERGGANQVVLPTLHGVYSIGVLVGSLCGAAAEAAGLRLDVHFAITATLGLAFGVSATRFLRDEDFPSAVPLVVGSRPTLREMGLPLSLLGIAGFCALFVEGGVINWSGVYLNEKFRAAPGVATTGLLGFSITMTIVRLSGGYLAKRLGGASLVRVGACVATAGIAIVLTAKATAPAVLGFTLIGAGIANAFPLVLSSCGHQPHVSSSTAIAAVSTVGYLGHLTAPAAIGIFAEWTSLTSGIGLIAIFTVAVAFLTSPIQMRRKE